MGLVFSKPGPESPRLPWWIDRDRYMKFLIIGAVTIVLCVIAYATVKGYEHGSWEVSTTVDPITDVKSVDAQVTSGDPISAATFTVRCSNGTSNVLIGLNASFAADYTFRFDRHPPITQSFLGDHDVRPLTDEVASVENVLARYARTSKRLVIRTYDRVNAPTDIYFNLRGNDIAFRELDKDCGK